MAEIPQRAMSLLETLKRYYQEAEEADYIMPVWLPFLPFLLMIIGYIGMIPAMLRAQGMGAGAGSAAVFAGFSAFTILMFIGAIINLYVLYKWIDRRNKHFKRASLFLTALSDLSGELRLSKAETIRSRVNEYRMGVSERSPILFVILSIIPLIGTIVLFYIYHFLNKDFASHSRTEKLILADVLDSLSERGISIPKRIEEFAVVPSRNTILYIVLLIITLGFFGFYWIYVLTKDPNEHFKSHRIFESELLRAFESLVRTTSMY